MSMSVSHVQANRGFQPFLPATDKSASSSNSNDTNSDALLKKQLSMQRNPQVKAVFWNSPNKEIRTA